MRDPYFTVKRRRSIMSTFHFESKDRFLFSYTDLKKNRKAIRMLLIYYLKRVNSKEMSVEGMRCAMKPLVQVMSVSQVYLFNLTYQVFIFHKNSVSLYIILNIFSNKRCWKSQRNSETLKKKFGLFEKVRAVP